MCRGSIFRCSPTSPAWAWSARRLVWWNLPRSTFRRVRRLRRSFPDAKILAGLWTNENNVERSRERLLQAGADEVVTRLPAAIQKLRDLAAPLTLAAAQQPKVNTSR